MMSEFENEGSYFLDLIDEELALTALQMDRFGATNDFEMSFHTNSISIDKARANTILSQAEHSRFSSVAGRTTSSDSEESLHMSCLDQAHQKHEYTVTLLGAPGIGKSALITSFMQRGAFHSEYEPTLVDEYSQQMFMLEKNGRTKRQVTLKIKD